MKSWFFSEHWVPPFWSSAGEGRSLHESLDRIDPALSAPIHAASVTTIAV